MILQKKNCVNITVGCVAEVTTNAKISQKKKQNDRCSTCYSVKHHDITALGNQRISSAVRSPTSHPHPSPADRHRAEPLSSHSILLAGIPLARTGALYPARPSPHPATLCRPRPHRPTRPHATAPHRRERNNHAPLAGRATQAANHRGAGTRRSHRLTSRGNRAGSGRSAGRVPRVKRPGVLARGRAGARAAQGRRQAGQLGRRITARRARAAGAHPASAPRVNGSMSLPAAGVAERAAPASQAGRRKQRRVSRGAHL